MQLPTLGWIGTGVMGRWMAGHLQAAGHPLVVHSRTRSKAAPLLEAGATWADTPAEVAARAEVVFTMVGLPSDVETVVLGSEGILSGSPGCRLLVDCTTSQPALAERIAEATAARGIGSVDAPVSGGDVGAREGKLVVFMGGSEAACAEAAPLVARFSRLAQRFGGPGAGQHAKMGNQIIVAGNMIGLCESLVYAARQGLDAAQLVEVVAQGAARSFAVENLGPRILKEDFAPGFFVEHFLKDLGIACEECARIGLDLPGLDLARRLYRRTADMGHGRSGTQALYLALNEGGG